MKRRLHLIIYIVSILYCIPASAQDSNMRQVYEQAEEAYSIGRIEQAMALLNNNIDNFQGGLKQSAYRLMALCNLGMDKTVEAENYAKELLKLAPYYSPSAQDPLRFSDIINRIKLGTAATIITASNQAESLEEVPVPVTLITEEMIQISGARNLKELLITYVPGMTNVECNEEMNIAMRGVYSSGQEKILFMLNGHRLNSYGTNVARPDFSMSLDKVKQIEVLRGPASSLYGGVALTAVINIITKSGTDVDGLKIKSGIGNYGQFKGDITLGTHYMDLDLMAWASIYNSSGEKIDVPIEEQKGIIPIPGSIYIGAYNRQPSYDVGVNITWKGFNILHNSNFSKSVAPYTMSYFFAPYSYKNYLEIDGNAPGYANYAHHSRLTYSHQFKNTFLSIGVTYDQETQVRYQIAGDMIPAELNYLIIPNGTEEGILVTEGAFQYHRWNEENYGMILQGSHNYTFGDAHKGTISAGMQYSHFKLSSSLYQEGHQYNTVLNTFDDFKNLYTGEESSANAYFQLKHQWQGFIVNAGIRYDYKLRRNKQEINEFSPRLALIYMLPKWNFKLSYAKSFVDAPYFYRNNTLDTTYGGEGLMSEYLHAAQLTISNIGLVPGLKTELNVFYNTVKNLVFSDGLLYNNAGNMHNIGIELSALYNSNRLTLSANGTWQRVLDFEYYKANEHEVYNIPSLTANVTAEYKLSKLFSIHANLLYTSKQTSLYEMPTEDGFYAEVIDINPRALLNMGICFEYKKFGINFNVHNLTNKKYVQGGTSIAPIRQQGLWYIAELSYKI